MEQIIGTYFYHDEDDQGAEYGNVFLPLNKRNIVYWQTVVTFFFGAIVVNGDSRFKYCLFTNVKDFPFRHLLEEYGVLIYDHIDISHRKKGKWSTSTYLFDVLRFLQTSKDFDDNSIFVLMDSDVLSLNESKNLYIGIMDSDKPFVYKIEDGSEKSENFHGLHLSRLNFIGQNYYNKDCKIKELIGGEFFAFRRNMIKHTLSDFDILRNNVDITTEEQVLSIANSIYNWQTFPNSIFRVWTTIKKFNVPKNYKSYIFLHLPSEKEYGLNVLFKSIQSYKPNSFAKNKWLELIDEHFILDCKSRNFIYKLSQKITKLLCTH